MSEKQYKITSLSTGKNVVVTALSKEMASDKGIAKITRSHVDYSLFDENGIFWHYRDGRRINNKGYSVEEYNVTIKEAKKTIVEETVIAETKKSLKEIIFENGIVFNTENKLHGIPSLKQFIKLNMVQIATHRLNGISYFIFNSQKRSLLGFIKDPSNNFNELSMKYGANWLEALWNRSVVHLCSTPIFGEDKN